MANITIENGIYSNLNNAYSNGLVAFTDEGKLAFSDNVVTDLRSGDTAAKLFDAVQIDWNGAYLDSANIQNGNALSINTTGDLMTLLNEMQKEVYMLSNKIIELASKTYYWYVGPRNPFTMSSIAPLSSNAASAGAGWRTIGSTLPTYSASNPLWNGTSITISSTRVTTYIAVPSEQIKSWSSFGQDITNESWEIESNKLTLEGVDYIVWRSWETIKTFTDILY